MYAVHYQNLATIGSFFVVPHVAAVCLVLIQQDALFVLDVYPVLVLLVVIAAIA